MRLYDMNTEKVYTLSELKKEWQEFSKSDPFNHADCFTTELFEILMATINGRNDCEIVGCTGKEISNIILKLRDSVFYKVPDLPFC